MTQHSIIDPPVGPYSSIEEIKDWIKVLEAMSDSEERDYCLNEARQWLLDHPDTKRGA